MRRQIVAVVAKRKDLIRAIEEQMTDRFSPAKPYRVSYGFAWGQHEDFHTASEAWGFYALTPHAKTPIHLEKYCGASDGNHSGLTEEEKELGGL